MKEKTETIILKNDLHEIHRLAEFLTGFLTKNNISQEIIMDINLCLEEAVTNIISYGFGDGAEHTITITLTRESDQLVCEVRDAGKAFNPLDHPMPDIDLPLERRPIGGLGIFFVRELADEVEYRRAGPENILTIKKNV